MKQHSPGEWRKATYSANGSHCVEAREHARGMDVRDTQNREAGHITFASSEWAALLSTVSYTPSTSPAPSTR